MTPIKSEEENTDDEVEDDEEPDDDDELLSDGDVSFGSDIELPASGHNLNTFGEEIQNLTTVLGTKLDNIHSTIERLVVATQQRNKLFAQLLSVLTKDGEVTALEKRRVSNLE